MLQLILMITLGVPNPGLMEQAYSHWLNYKLVDRGEVSTDLASAWGAPGMAHRAYVTMQPASGARIYLRFVRVDPASGYTPMRTTGWNAIESFVQDPDDLARRLSAAGSPFKIEGQPRPLGPNSPIRAMQVRGPAQEILYFTHVPSPPGQPPHAMTNVDRPFVVVVGGTQLDAMRQFYHDLGAMTDDRTMQARITVLNRAFGLDVNTTHSITMARISPQYSIEIDGYPAAATARATRPNELPPAIATVSFEVNSLDDLKLRATAAPRAIAQFPYQGRRVAVIRGPAGELIELVEQRK
jgi:catechol 2,3-dioxygenase-like lactoylglutathione lyase family enzyme